MKNKELALKISKHPLVKKVAKLEDKRVVARLIVEELSQEQKDDLKDYDAETDEAIRKKDEKDLKARLDQINNALKAHKDPEVVAILKPMLEKVKNALGIKAKEAASESEVQKNLKKIKQYMRDNGLLFQIQNNIYGPDKVFAWPGNRLDAYIADKELSPEQLKNAKNHVKMLIAFHFLQYILEQSEMWEEREKRQIKIKGNTFQAMKFEPHEVGESETVIANARKSAFLLKKMEPGDETTEEPDDSDDKTELINNVVKTVDGSLTDFLNFLKNKITGGFEEPESEEQETIQEGIFDNIKKALARIGKPEKLKVTFIKLLSKYLKGSAIEVNKDDLETYWNEWSESKGQEAKMIISAYSYHLLKFKKPELLGTKIRNLADSIVVGGKSKLDKFIEEIVEKAFEMLKIQYEKKKTLQGIDFDNEQVLDFSYIFKTILEQKNIKKGTIDKLMINDKFIVPAKKQLIEKLKKLQAEMFLQVDEKILGLIAKVINGEEEYNIGDGSIKLVKGVLGKIKDNIDQIKSLSEKKDTVIRHINYLLKEDKRIKDFLYKYIIYKNTEKDFKSLKPALKKLAIFLKKSENYSLKESLSNLSDRFEGKFEKKFNLLMVANFKKEELEKLNSFFKFKNNVDYFVKYFFPDALKGPEEEAEDEKFTYSFMVVKALNKQTEEKKKVLKTYHKLLNKKINNLKDKNKEPQIKKYSNLKNELVFLFAKLQEYQKIINIYLKSDRESSEKNYADGGKQKDIYGDILEDFSTIVFKKDLGNPFKLIQWADNPDNIIQFANKTQEASQIYLKDLEKWGEMPTSSEKAKAFLYDYRTLIRDQEDGEIKQYIDRLGEIDDEIRTGKEQDPKDEKADSAIPRERYEYFIQEAKPIAKFLQQTPITFDDNTINFGDKIELPNFNNDLAQVAELIKNINRNELDKSKLFKYIGSPENPDEAKKRILSTIEIIKKFQQAKKDGLANDEQTYNIFLEEVKDNLTHFEIGWPLFRSGKGKIILNTPYADNTDFNKLFGDENLQKEISRMSNMGGRQTKEAVKSKYSGKIEEQQNLTAKLNELTKLRNFEIARDCGNIYEKHLMSEDAYREYRRDPNFINQGEKRYDEPEWKKIKKLIEDIMSPFWNNIKDAPGIADIENKEAYKKFLNTYKDIVQTAQNQGREKDVTQNKKDSPNIQEQITKLIKPLLIKKFKRKQNG